MDLATARQHLIENGYLPGSSKREVSDWIQAARANQQSILDAYLAIGMPVDATDDWTTALMKSIESNHLELGKWLLEQGADPKVRDSLHLSVEPC